MIVHVDYPPNKMHILSVAINAYIVAFGIEKI